MKRGTQLNKSNFFNYNITLEDTLSQSELEDLFYQFSIGDLKVREKLILANLRLVILVVHRFMAQFEYIVIRFMEIGFDEEDFFHVGVIGLMKAIDSFDLSRKVSFFTYASKCVTNELFMFIRKNKKNLGNFSLEEPIFYHQGENSFLLCDTLIDDHIDFVFDYERKEANIEVRQLLSSLSDIERTIVMLYYGFYSDKLYTQKEIADIMNISQSYISRILQRALKKLRIKMKINDSVCMKRRELVKK